MSDNLLEKIERFKIPFVLFIVGVVLIIGGLVASNVSKPKEYPKESLVQGQKLVSVDVSGAVNTPGVYQLTDSSRIEDAIQAAGGFSDKASAEYISKYLNLAQKIVDGTKIYIPLKGEQVSGVQTSNVASSEVSKININTASQSELEALSGVGPATASKIISARPYSTVEELLGKKVVGKALFEKIKDSIVVY